MPELPCCFLTILFIRIIESPGETSIAFRSHELDELTIYINKNGGLSGWSVCKSQGLRFFKLHSPQLVT